MHYINYLIIYWLGNLSMSGLHFLSQGLKKNIGYKFKNLHKIK